MSAAKAGAPSRGRLPASREGSRRLYAALRRPAEGPVERPARLRDRYDAIPPWVKELVLCLAAAAATVYRIGTGAPSPGDRTPDVWAYGIGLAMAATMVVRRRWPAVTLAVTGLLWTIYHVDDYPGGAPAVPLWIALYSAAVAPRRWLALPIAGWVIVSDVLGRTEHGRAGVFDAVLDGSTVVFVAMLLLGDAVRSRRGRRDEYEARLASLAAQRDHAAAQRVAEERIRIARDLHDVSAHTLAVISLHAGLAAELLTEDPAEASEALTVVRRATRDALGELRAAVGVLRDGVAAPYPEEPATLGVRHLGELARAYGEHGPRIEIHVEGEPQELPSLVDVTAYRIVQEALANAVRHADPGLVEIVVRYGAGGLAVEVRDDGGTPSVVRSDADLGQAGLGLRGMAERVAALDGRLTAGAYERPGTGERGFRVHVWLPLGGST
ncbi:histidine kinase [Actinoallomurus bryophytorum]|uniref:histidine kinase n=1 Tax=Actinoallomurus bryophytorum TaxID=1490222 RepID=A0A543CGP8_9ACTN|nr:histidine kinase [Actinoallomurus bryophytorum]TQL96248.1 histidine kinase/DNA gyrase B/HSP90-like ATPase [Actinoallomurus bryophytorum]